ncbi:MAG: hypothetical protein JWQ81_4510 [Amycolatopsis sp.]|uniref:DUF2567 domain-containing protein n=1 Tax=Amycolatopsis sp. TaxID=37632 RepID=UPI00261C650C|nr:DUF2567 domain-containing protein [Amycolatopsis sp.]MCU1683771.1 hypothetical protein [Amycolatopsis sp.]
MPRVEPRVVVKADLLPAVTILSTAGLLGIPLGWLWSLMAPAEHVRIITAVGDRAPLELESWHRFDDLGIYTVMSIGVGLLIGAVVWLLRERRGPVALIAAAAGSTLASWLGMQIGSAFATAHYKLDSSPALGAVIAQAPVLESSWVLVAAPMATALVYLLLASWNSHDDLGRRLG